MEPLGPAVKRDVTGKFLPKRPLEFTWPHFWLEVSEIAAGILLAQLFVFLLEKVIARYW